MDSHDNRIGRLINPIALLLACIVIQFHDDVTVFPVHGGAGKLFARPLREYNGRSRSAQAARVIPTSDRLFGGSIGVSARRRSEEVIGICQSESRFLRSAVLEASVDFSLQPSQVVRFKQRVIHLRAPGHKRLL